MSGINPALGTSTPLRLANLDLLPFLVAEFERAGVAWSAERQPGLAAHVEAKHGGDPEKFAAVDRACDAVKAAAGAMDPATAGDGEDDEFAGWVLKALRRPEVQAEIRRQFVLHDRRNGRNSR